ncbi:hypothetical protein BaRGS_00035161, partial [Batillaria attramentaria]
MNDRSYIQRSLFFRTAVPTTFLYLRNPPWRPGYSHKSCHAHRFLPLRNPAVDIHGMQWRYANEPRSIKRIPPPLRAERHDNAGQRTAAESDLPSGRRLFPISGPCFMRSVSSRLV